MNVLAFDIETVPDVEGGSRLYGLEGLPNTEKIRAMQAIHHRTAGRRELLRHHLQRVVAISVVFRHASLEGGLRVWSLGESASSEGELIQHFFDGLERYTPTLVSWNGSGFDLPVLHYRSLFQGVVAPQYWEEGQSEREFRFNNYLNRFHRRHTDLMDVLSGYQGGAFGALDEVALLAGLPGKMGMEGSQVVEAWLDGEIQRIRDYCETDALNTYGLYLLWLVNTGALGTDEAVTEQARLYEYLINSGRPHLQDFAQAWEEKCGS